jgi:hypothetical protein
MGLIAGVLTYCRAIKSHNRAEAAHETNMVEMKAQFEHLVLGATGKTFPLVDANRAASADVCSPRRFRLVGLFRSHSQTWGSTDVDDADVLSPSPAKPQPLLLKKKQKMRILA